jgi:hypothetical protein
MCCHMPHLIVFSVLFKIVSEILKNNNTSMNCTQGAFKVSTTLCAKLLVDSSLFVSGSLSEVIFSCQMIPFFYLLLNKPIFTGASYIDCLGNLWIFMYVHMIGIFSKRYPFTVFFVSITKFTSFACFVVLIYIVCCLFPQDLLHLYNRNGVSVTRASFFTFVLEDSNNTFTCLSEYTLGLLLLESVLKFATKNLWSHVPIVLILWYRSLELFVFHVPVPCSMFQECLCSGNMNVPVPTL